MTETITLDTAIAVVSQVAATQHDAGYDFVYQEPPDSDSCVYTAEDGGPSCLVGCAMDHFDIPRPAYGDSINKLEVTSDQLQWRGRFTPEAMHFLRLVQDAQDTGMQWGEAIAMTVNEMKYV